MACEVLASKHDSFGIVSDFDNENLLCRSEGKDVACLIAASPALNCRSRANGTDASDSSVSDIHPRIEYRRTHTESTELSSGNSWEMRRHRYS